MEEILRGTYPFIIRSTELGGGRSRWAALLDRAARTFGQTLAASIGSALVWSDVNSPRRAQLHGLPQERPA